MDDIVGEETLVPGQSLWGLSLFYMRFGWADRHIFDKAGHSRWIEGGFLKIPHAVGLIFLHAFLLDLQNLLFRVCEMHFPVDEHIEAITDIMHLVNILARHASLVLDQTTDLQQSLEVLRNVLEVRLNLQQISNGSAFFLVPRERWTRG